MDSYKDEEEEIMQGLGFQAEPSDCSLLAKCGSSSSSTNNVFPTDMDELILPASLANFPPSSLSCACFDPNCKLRRYFRNQQRICNNSHLQQQQERRREARDNMKRLNTSRESLLRLSGGVSAAEAVYERCRGLLRRQPLLLTPTASAVGDTVLMQLCSRTPSPKEEEQQKLLHAQISAFIRLHFESDDPQMLFARNGQGRNAMELAGLTNKAEVAEYLALLYGQFGRDANEASEGFGGHTVLHMLARKGDDCADALECLLRLRTPDDDKRLFRLDVVNEGRKTPLDVAVACAVMFSTGKDRAVYDRVIRLFHEVILEEAREMEEKPLPQQKLAGMTFRNI